MNGKRKVPTLRKRAVNTSNNPVADGKPLELDLSLLDEDNQAREGEYDEEFLKELAEAIKNRGVKTPISVRENPEKKGRFIINHGHCRTRSSLMAGKKTIPGFIDNDHNEDDQVVENIQRNGLKPRQIANYIGRKMAKGLKKGEIAKAVSKSNAWVTQHAALLDLPEPIAVIFNDGQCNDVTVINELIKVHKSNPEEVTDWLEEEEQDFSRGSVKMLREFLDDKQQHEGENVEQEQDDNSTNETENNAKKEKKESDPDKLKKAIVLVMHNNREARMMLNRRPSADGWAWLKYEDDGEEFESDLGEVALMSIMEG